ncbi:hypothetical protein D8674_034907 [Pyrus ussuriensis x Pyrus communis]|uniref:Uncharacterized protein n=1 Tax=Pyrus ussuriensis x Pyrus communis TaxID=2448454 RepID=A0A5N5GFL7_9ROSA|nr:hypothetical protein D8674_034907 [Pyrus ussuriensis x Pyrus communis]
MGAVSVANAIACRDGDHNNKENIPPTPIPLSATAKAKLTNAVSADSKKCNKMRLRRRRMRKPLADITNLYICTNSVQFPCRTSLSLSSSSVSISVSTSASISTKRKSLLPVASPNSKSLRMGFR